MAESVKQVVQSIIARYSAEQSGKAKRAQPSVMVVEVQRLYAAIAQDIITCIGMIDASSDKFTAYHQLYIDHKEGRISSIGAPQGLAPLAEFILQTAKDIRHLESLTKGMSPLLAYFPVIGNQLSGKLTVMASELTRPITAKNYPAAAFYLRAFREHIISPLRMHAATHAFDMQKMNVPRGVITQVQAPLDAATKAA